MKWEEPRKRKQMTERKKKNGIMTRDGEMRTKRTEGEGGGGRRGRPEKSRRG